ncbi:SGNH/GDSL hydrolase family protein [Roseisalinus antarcticus]|uniref:SGNH hydrolase-type esterase domain-containing protein n=1 Tax=Roseisalinus antarcticus TaxID=254357 RepID=A0A1Y5SL13_9RHOB|nr:SGNH/GDSL hydrolase family protein [Roseisalinus antarcticus]SLN42872.1 hypothetical protein ROA7023_01736 [Roseisalinus antarcticus]
MPVCLTFGDSNTYGTPPMVARGVPERYDRGVRWTGVCAAELGPGWEVVEEGLPGRTAQFEDPVMGSFMDGRTGLRIALQSHGPIDVLTVMLGTNDIKTRFAPEPGRVTAGIACLLDIALSDEMQLRHGRFRVLVICPPKVREVGILKGEFLGAESVAAALPDRYAALAAARGAGFLDANNMISVSDVDGIHLEASAHRVLGAAVADAVRSL